MNNVNKTLYIPLYGKSKVSKQGIILKDSMAEKIWELESFKIKGKSKSKIVHGRPGGGGGNRFITASKASEIQIK